LKNVARLALVCAAAAAAAWAGDRLAAQSVPRERPVPGSVFTRVPLVCGTDARVNLQRFRPLALEPMVDGQPLSFEQSPPLLSPDYTGDFGLRRFLVVGDFATVQFRRADVDDPNHIETWQRTTTTTIGSRVISIFEPAWHDSDLGALLQHRSVGYDNPEVYWGSYLVPGVANAERPVWLRMTFSGVPSSPVRRISDTVQFASNVVNIVVPDFEDSRVTAGAQQYNFASAARVFYQSFADQYESVAFVPVASALGEFSAFHGIVKNTVTGLGMATGDQSSVYGSGGTLQGIELYGAGHLAQNAASTHEFAHQWGDTFDWAKIAGITTAGHEPGGHAPLWWAGETLLGAVLAGDRRVTQNGTGFQIERTPSPIHYHPIELYSMGLIGRDQVPDLTVFKDQGQFSTTSTSRPDPGAPVQGDSTIVKIGDIIREHGVRAGPVPGDWRRATVVVSRAGLISQAEMDYWNFFAQRIGDRNHTGVLSVEGFGSPFSATRGRVSLSTAIQPKSGGALPETLPIDYPDIGPRDLRGVTLTGPLPTHFSTGQTTTVAGHVTATDAVDFNQALMFFQPFDSSSSDAAVRSAGTVSRSGDFSFTVRFTDAQKGRYYVGIVLFWPNSGPQFARTYLTPIVVE
jgi:hypothetical protein